LQNEAFEKSFEKLTRNTTKLEDLRGEVEKILATMENSDRSYSWLDRVKSTKGKYLSTFSKYKSHKKNGGLRMIVNESDTFQNQTSLFLKSGLSKLDCRDPFKVKNSEELIEKLDKVHGKGKRVFSLDAENMYMNLNVPFMLEAVQEAIVEFGIQKFENEVKLDVLNFLELIRVYLKTTIIKINNQYYRQKKGVCIGCRIAPYLSDIYLGKVNRLLMEEAARRNISEEELLGARFVDDYLFLGDIDKEWDWIKDKLQEYAISLTFTQEDPEDNEIQFLDVRITKVSYHLCWRYAQRSVKPVLSFRSNHTKIIKRGIIESLLYTACRKSCIHEMDCSFKGQVKRLEDKSYPRILIKQIALKVALKIVNGSKKKEPEEKLKVVCVPFYHGVGHRLKKAARAFDLNVVFSFPHKLGRLPAQMNREKRECPTAPSKHIEYVDCKDYVIYAMPLSCGKWYVGQTFRCVNERLTEHHRGMQDGSQGTLSIKEHKRKCPCTIKPDKTKYAPASRSRVEREVQEAYVILKHKDIVISSPSIVIQRAEEKILKKAPQRISRQLFNESKM
jgi:hypothetical protein